MAAVFEEEREGRKGIQRQIKKRETDKKERDRKKREMLTENNNSGCFRGRKEKEGSIETERKRDIYIY